MSSKHFPFRFIDSVRNFDGGFGAVPGAETHAGQIFCCVRSQGCCPPSTKICWWGGSYQSDSATRAGRVERAAGETA